MTYLFVGLGNPGEEYENTRHNAGFAAVDLLLEKLGATKIKTKLLASVARAKTESGEIFVMKPMTFMNESGNAVAPFVKTKKIPLKNTVVVHDDLDLPLGEIRVSKNASSAGHNGVQSVIDRLGSKDFTRIRLGIGPRPSKIPADKFVLGRFTNEEKTKLPDILDRAAGACLAEIK
jgi:PTH1 family peptidyl-tRNA hydrolase